MCVCWITALASGIEELISRQRPDAWPEQRRLVIRVPAEEGISPAELSVDSNPVLII